jgi:hypothetical protein
MQEDCATKIKEMKLAALPWPTVPAHFSASQEFLEGTTSD